MFKSPMRVLFDQKYRAWLSGHCAEIVSAFYLRLKWYSVLRRRFKCPVGEIDLIVAKGQTVVFVEVKYRKNFDLALFSLTPKQQKRIMRAAALFMAHSPPFEQIRFDVIVVNRYYQLKHLKNIFNAPD